MYITLNGEKTSLSSINTVDDLVNHLEFTGKVAVEINQEIVPRSRFCHHQINEGDTVEIVHAIGGG